NCADLLIVRCTPLFRGIERLDPRRDYTPSTNAIPAVHVRAQRPVARTSPRRWVSAREVSSPYRRPPRSKRRKAVRLTGLIHSLTNLMRPVERRGSPEAPLRGRILPRLEHLEARLVPAAWLSISDATVVEGDSGRRDAVLTVSLTGHTLTTTVDYA